MQTLQFETAWEKAVAERDRQYIEELFQNTKELKSQDIDCHIIRTAINHKQQMLVTVLIHNFTEQPLAFKERVVRCLLEHGSVAQKFTIPALTIPPFTSMPWTFIYESSDEFLFTEILKVEIVSSF